MLRILALALLGCGPKVATGPQPSLADNACFNNVTPIAGGVFVVAATWRGIPVKVNIDTGAVGGAVSAQIVKRYRLPVVGTTTVTGASGTTVTADVHDVGPLKLGNVEIDGKTLTSDSAHADRFDFTIGLAQLRQYAMVLDVDERSFCLGPSPHALATTPMRLVGDPERGQAVVVSAQFGSDDGPLELTEMVLDTGAGAMLLREDLVARVVHTFEKEDDLLDSVGHRFKRPYVRVPEICVAKTCIHDQLVVSTPDFSKHTGFPVDGIIGVPFLASRRLVIDFPARKFSLTERPH